MMNVGVNAKQIHEGNSPADGLGTSAIISSLYAAVSARLGRLFETARRVLAFSGAPGYLERGWVIANHKLVSFHAAFISSVLNLPAMVEGKMETLQFMFLSAETIVSLIILYLSWHIGIAIHELGHYLTAGRLTALNKTSQEHYDAMKGKSSGVRLPWLAKAFILIPWGKFEGVKKDEGNFAPDAPYNLAVAASGPIWSSYMAMAALPIAIICLALGLSVRNEGLIYVGRFLLAPGVVGLLDRLLADRGKVREFRTREKMAAGQAARAAAAISKESWLVQVGKVKQRLLTTRMQQVILKDGTRVTAPWQFRNCAMGGRHTEKEYPESNISMQESMFMPLSAKTYEEAQEMTVKLQYRLKEIIESAPGAKVMGVGSEGGIATYIDKEPQDRVPEQRMWRMMKQTILDCEYVPGVDVAIALDPAASELENAYREETGQKDSVGMYRFWRDKTKVDMSRDEILDLYKQTMNEGIPVLSIEDGFGELDHAGWRLLMKELGDKIFIIGDDLVTTKDENIENCARGGEINTALIKANQIGTLSETVLAMLTALGYGAELVVSHRSKSPNDPFEAEISTAMNTLGMKAGGGANTERLQKYGRVMEIIALAKATQRELTVAERKETEDNLRELLYTLTGRKDVMLAANAGELDLTSLLIRMLAIETVSGTEEATNAGIPSAAATLFLGRTGIIRFKGQHLWDNQPALMKPSTILTASSGRASLRGSTTTCSRMRATGRFDSKRMWTLHTSRPRMTTPLRRSGRKPAVTTARAVWRQSSISRRFWRRHSSASGCRSWAACWMWTGSCCDSSARRRWPSGCSAKTPRPRKGQGNAAKGRARYERYPVAVTGAGKGRRGQQRQGTVAAYS